MNVVEGREEKGLPRRDISEKTHQYELQISAHPSGSLAYYRLGDILRALLNRVGLLLNKVVA
jgi:hypothetical protein